MNQPSQSSKEYAILQLIRQVLQFEHLLESGYVESLSNSISTQAQHNVTDLGSEVESLRQVSGSLQEQIGSMSQMIEMLTGYYEQTETRLDLTSGRLISASANNNLATSTNISESYLAKIRQVIFSTENKLQHAIPNSFYIGNKQATDISNFLGVYEKAGLTYLAFVALKSQAPRLPVAMAINNLLDKVILGSRFADSVEILQSIDNLLASFVDDTNQMDLGLFVMEKLSMTMSYHSTKLTLFHAVRGVVQDVKSASIQQNFMPFASSSNSTYLDKGTIFKGDNTLFYLANETVFTTLGNGQRDMGVEAFKQLLSATQNMSLTDQRNTIEQQLSQVQTNSQEEIQVLAFQF